MNERMRFVVRREAGESMTDLCREFGISRKTGHKIWNRYKEFGPEGLGDFSRRPGCHPNRTAEEIRDLVVATRLKYPKWGPKKLRALLQKEHPGLPIPAASTIGELLSKRGLAKPRRRRRRATPTALGKLTVSNGPNDVWCADFKGQFRMKNGKYCYPLTITDLHSRFLLACVALESTHISGAYSGFHAAFREYGLPKCIRTDNGAPFASTGLHGLTRLSVWWMRLGIRPERIEPGHPEQNGAHERMHLTMVTETTRPAGANVLHQQENFDRFRQRFNEVRPHEALGMQRPSDVYSSSRRRMPCLLPELEYPLHDTVRRVHRSGHVCIRKGCQPYVSAALAGEYVGLRKIEPKVWRVSFLGTSLGDLYEETRRLVWADIEVLEP